MRDFWAVAFRSSPGRNVQIENVNDTSDVIRQRRVKDQAIFSLSLLIYKYTRRSVRIIGIHYVDSDVDRSRGQICMGYIIMRTTKKGYHSFIHLYI